MASVVEKSIVGSTWSLKETKESLVSTAGLWVRAGKHAAQQPAKDEHHYQLAPVPA